jgi:hypothetical protein
MRPALVFISSILIWTFLLVKSNNLCKGLQRYQLTIFLNLSRFFMQKSGCTMINVMILKNCVKKIWAKDSPGF